VVDHGIRGEMRPLAGSRPVTRPRGLEQWAADRRAEITGARLARMRVWRGDARHGDFEDYDVPFEDGEVVLDVLHRL
jgi:hypothetical protein